MSKIRLLGKKEKAPLRDLSTPPAMTDPALVYDVIVLVQGNVAPLAIVMRELMEKLARLEDKLGVTDATVAAETAPPKGEPFSPVAQAALRSLDELFPKPAEDGAAPQVVIPMNGMGGDLE